MDKKFFLLNRGVPGSEVGIQPGCKARMFREPEGCPQTGAQGSRVISVPLCVPESSPRQRQIAPAHFSSSNPLRVWRKTQDSGEAPADTPASLGSLSPPQTPLPSALPTTAAPHSQLRHGPHLSPESQGLRHPTRQVLSFTVRLYCPLTSSLPRGAFSVVFRFCICRIRMVF